MKRARRRSDEHSIELERGAPAPRLEQRRRYPVGGAADRRQPQRRHPTHPTAASHSTDPWQTPRSRAPKVYADHGYDHDKYRTLVLELGITAVIARRGTEHGSRLGRLRWVVERSIALLHWFRRPHPSKELGVLGRSRRARSAATYLLVVRPQPGQAWSR